MINSYKQLFKNSNCVKKGIISGCPFCKAINACLPQVGNNIRVLSGIFGGLIGEVVESIYPLRAGEILVHFIDSPQSETYVISTDSDLVDLLQESPIPQWAPPLSLKQIASLHWLILSFCHNFSLNNEQKHITIDFLNLSVYIWMKRLPLEPIDLWSILKAHGITSKWKNRLLESFNQFCEVLKIYHFVNTGRNYKKKKKEKPFSVEGIR